MRHEIPQADGQVAAALGGQPAQLDGEQVDQHQTQPENRHGHADEGQHHEHIVQDGILMQRREHADAHADDQGNDQRRDRDLQRIGDTLCDQIQHGPVIHIGVAEIPPEHIEDIIHKLLPIGLVQPQLDLHFRDVRRGGLGAQDRGRGAARDHPGQDEGEGHYNEHRRDALQDSLQDCF